MVLRMNDFREYIAEIIERTSCGIVDPTGGKMWGACRAMRSLAGKDYPCTRRARLPDRYCNEHVSPPIPGYEDAQYCRNEAQAQEQFGREQHV